MFPQLPRFEAVSRRRFLQGSLLIGAVALVPGIACSDSSDDAKTLQAGSASTTAATSAPTAADPATTETTAGDTATTDTTDTAVPDTAAADTAAADTTAAATVPAGDPLPTGAQLEVSFTYAVADGGGRVRNPYIAVWIETPAGDLVQTLSLWYSQRESKYVSHLKRWYNAESSLLDAGGVDNTDTISGATRAAGDFQLVWDGTDVTGTLVGQGDYVVCIEAAREHGPYSLTTGTVTLGSEAVTVALPDDGELSAASAAFVV